MKRCIIYVFQGKGLVCRSHRTHTLQSVLKCRHKLKAFAEWGHAQIYSGAWWKPGLRAGNVTAMILAGPERPPGATECSNM